MRRGLLAVLLALVLAPAAMAENDPKSLVLEVTNANIRAQYGKVWTRLHPRYRTVTSRAFWENCQRKKAKEIAGVEWLSIKVTETYPDVIALPLLGRTSVTAVSLEARVEYLGQKTTVRDTIYVKKVGSTWFGLWEPDTYRAYKARRCPT